MVNSWYIWAWLLVEPLLSIIYTAPAWLNSIYASLYENGLIW